ncbi:MAG: hypothetical protein KatS3mg103_0112 [Phycisphaerales bacterium]|nr:MAG: hypothetical protein KatS3mg103_0112 [Phycisphaerales bacterium]
MASTGLVGLGVYALVLVVMARVAWSARLHRHPYASAVPWALLGLFLAGMFEVVHLNTHVLAMWHLLMGLAVAASVDAAVGQGAGSSRAGGRSVGARVIAGMHHGAWGRARAAGARCSKRMGSSAATGRASVRPSRSASCQGSRPPAGRL